MTARERLLPGVLGLLIFVLLGAQVSPSFWSEWWFYVGLGTTIAAVFVEPFFGRAQDATVNACADIGAWGAASRTTISSLWLTYLIFVLAVLACALIAELLPKSVSRRWKLGKRAANQLASRMGRAVVIGGAALTLEVVRLAHDHEDGYVQPALGTATLVAALTPNWARLLRVARGADRQPADALATIGPRLLLVAADANHSVGAQLDVVGRLGEARGWVVAIRPAAGPVLEITLDRDVGCLCHSFPDQVTISSRTGSPTVVGSAGPGTTDITLVFNPLCDLRVGDPVEVGTGDDTRVFQVSELELHRDSWRGDAVVTPVAKAMQVGRPEGGWIRTHPRLPSAHDLVYRTGGMSQQVPPGFARLSVMKGSDVEVGVDIESPTTGHFAVLGISGMGKTSVALTICRAMSGNCCVVALDTTGEYRSRQGIPTEIPENLGALGLWVRELTGDPPESARKYIEHAMKIAYDEYVAGGDPMRRVLILEEAHGFVPEQNISTFAHRDETVKSTRFIMQSRKFGLRFVMVSQRAAVVSKSALSQCENYVALRTTDQTSLTYLESALGMGVRHLLPRLERYEAICMGPAFNVDAPVVVTLDSPTEAAPLDVDSERDTPSF